MSAARDYLAAIASAPRPAGASAESSARDYCASALRAAGFDVTERGFNYSTFPGRWGTPISGVFALMLFLALGHLGSHGHPGAALALLGAGGAIVGIFAWWLGSRGVLDLPFARASGINLVATRSAPTLWLVAHLDSKSQPISIVVRALAIIATMIMLGVVGGVAVAQLVVPMPFVVWIALTLAGVLVSLPVIASVVGARSAGALDNASGVATVLRTVDLLPRELPIGVVLTSAEELGLAGARAWARRALPATAINIDGVDDSGDVRLIYSGRVPRALLTMLGSAWPAPSKLPPGLLMDGVALANAGWEVLNVSKGSWRTVSRIHTPRDSLAHLEGSGAEEVAALLAGAIIASRR